MWLILTWELRYSFEKDEAIEKGGTDLEIMDWLQFVEELKDNPFQRQPVILGDLPISKNCRTPSLPYISIQRGTLKQSLVKFKYTQFIN